MPDFTFEYHQQCKKGHDGQRFNIRGYTQYIALDERTEATCTCPAFKYSRSFPKNCKHIDAALKEMCHWHSMHGEPQIEKGKCPECGGETKTVRVAV